jgi:hypothetical protein
VAEENQLRPQAKITPSEDFSEDYANNFVFEPSDWDFKIVFGQLDQMSKSGIVNWHTAITMPWGVAKLLSYFLPLNILAYEITHGVIKLPEGALPQMPTEPTGEEDTQQNRLFYQLHLNMHKSLLADEPQIPSWVQTHLAEGPKDPQPE